SCTLEPLPPTSRQQTSTPRRSTWLKSGYRTSSLWPDLRSGNMPAAIAGKSENRRTDRPMDRLSLSVRDVVGILLILATIIFNYATMTGRADNLQQRIAAIEGRYEREVVPRTEHVQMNLRLEERLGRIELQLNQLLARDGRR